MVHRRLNVIVQISIIPKELSFSTFIFLCFQDFSFLCFLFMYYVSIFLYFIVSFSSDTMGSDYSSPIQQKYILHGPVLSHLNSLFLLYLFIFTNSFSLYFFSVSFLFSFSLLSYIPFCSECLLYTCFSFPYTLIPWD